MPKKPGPTAQSAEVIELHGNPGKHTAEEIERRRASTPVPRPLVGEPPSDLTPLELECWKLHAPELETLNLLSVLDRGSFRIACQAYALARAAFRELVSVDDTTGKTSFGIMADDPAHGGGLRRHPALIVWKQAAGEYRAWCVEFGLTPSSRVGIRPGYTPGGEEGSGSDGDTDSAFFGT